MGFLERMSTGGGRRSSRGGGPKDGSGLPRKLEASGRDPVPGPALFLCAGQARCRPYIVGVPTMSSARKAILKRPDEFQRCYRQGKRYKNRVAVLHVYHRGDSEPARVGFPVSKKVGKAVERNRVKRWLRAIVLALSPAASSRIRFRVFGAHPGQSLKGIGLSGTACTNSLSRASSYRKKRT